MRAFQVACIALVAASACALDRFGLGSSYYGTGYGLGGASYTTSYAPATAYSTGYTQGPAAYGYAAAPATIRYASAGPAAYSYAAPAAYSYAAAPVAAAPVYTQSIATTGPATVKSHEIHTASGRQAIRIEESQAGDQVIRVHEAPQAGPQIAQIRVPGEQHHVRVVNHQSGPAEVQRVVQRQPTQVFDVQKQGRPGARIVQVVRGESAAPTVEFVNAGGSNHHVYHANDIASGSTSSGLGTTAYGTSYGTSYGAPAYSTSYSAPSYSTGLTYHAGPSYSTGLAYHAAPAYTTGYSAPSYSTGVSYHAAPSTISYSGSLGGYGSTGSYGSTAVISKA